MFHLARERLCHQLLGHLSNKWRTGNKFQFRHKGHGSLQPLEPGANDSSSQVAKIKGFLLKTVSLTLIT